MGCKVVANRHGTLALRLHWRGRRSWEGTGHPDTKANRQAFQRLADAITAEIRARQFTPERYLHYFPRGNLAREFRPPVPQVARIPTIRERYASWITRQQPPLVRPAQARDYRLHLTRYVLSTPLQDGRLVGDLPITALTYQLLAELQAALLTRPKKREGTGTLSVKTVRNVIDGSLRALLADARRAFRDPPHTLEVPDPFPDLTWPARTVQAPDPFTAGERDRIAGWFYLHDRFYYAFVVTLFFTGMRPSEAVALHWGDVDVVDPGSITIERSRYLGAEGAPKTAGSMRTLPWLWPLAREVLRNVKPLHAREDAYVFTNEIHGGPIDQRHWSDRFRRALRGLGIRPRKFYATRHTFISWALSVGLNPKFIAEYCGTSVAMIDRHYGKFMRDRAEAQLRLLLDAELRPELRREATGNSEPETFEGGSPVQWQKALDSTNAGDGDRTRTGETPTGF